MTDRRISDDWSEVDEVASVVSFSSCNDNESDNEDNDNDDLVSHSSSRPASPLLRHQQSVPQSQPKPHSNTLSSDPDRAVLLPLRPISPDLRPLSLSQTVPSGDSVELNPAPTTASHGTINRHPTTPQLDFTTTATTTTTTNNNPTDTTKRDTVLDTIPNTIEDTATDTIQLDDDDAFILETLDTSDPNTYHAALTAAIALIETTTEKAVRLGASRISTLSFLKSTCDELHKHTKELEPILSTYARRWKDGAAKLDQGDMPLNPSLLEWISHLRSQLLNAQSVMDGIPLAGCSGNGHPTSGLSAQAIPLHVNVALAGCSESLEDALTTIEDFMPIFKTDFDEAQTRRMHIPVQAVEGQTSQPRRTPLKPNVARVRQELYSLNDQLRLISTLLSSLCLPATTSATMAVTVPDVVSRLNNVTEVISIILTNHASDWLESGMQSSRRTIGYDEFLALDPEVLYDITAHLAELYEGLAVDEPEMRGMYSSEMIRNHQTVLLFECGQLQELSSVAELLESLVLPNY